MHRSPSNIAPTDEVHDTDHGSGTTLSWRSDGRMDVLRPIKKNFMAAANPRSDLKARWTLWASCHVPASCSDGVSMPLACDAAFWGVRLILQGPYGRGFVSAGIRMNPELPRRPMQLISAVNGFIVPATLCTSEFTKCKQCHLHCRHIYI